MKSPEREMRCLDCRSAPPPTETNYTLISMGWRLVRRTGERGAIHIEWRCPTCWARFKQANAGDPLARSGEQLPGDSDEGGPPSRRY